MVCWMRRRAQWGAGAAALCVLCLAMFIPAARADTARAKAALEHFYRVMGGEYWFNSNGWNEGDPCERGWYGVRCNGPTIEGRVLQIHLGSNNVNGRLEDTDLSGCVFLRDLYLSDNNITGGFPVYMTNMIAMQGFVFANNQLTGTIPSELHKNRNLIDLDLNDNNMVGPIPSEIGALPELDMVLIRNNRFSGTIPPQLLSGHIRQCDVAGNQLTGNIPDMTGYRLELMFASHNLLSGTIGDFGPAMQRFDVSHNQLHGYIPKSVENIERLVRFNIEYNELSGTIPPELGHVRSLLYLGHNYLSGSIPQNLTHASRLYTEFNKLYGSLPPFLQSYPQNMIGAVDIRGNAYWCPLPHWCSKPLGGNGMCDPCVKPQFCCHPHEGSACSDIEISECVCGKMPSCCTGEWGPECVNAMEKFQCGICVHGPCCYVHETPYCENSRVSQCVCEYMPSCCADAWTQECIDVMVKNKCGECDGPASNCCQPHLDAACTDTRIANCVCDREPGCCGQGKHWNETCVSLVNTYHCGACA